MAAAADLVASYVERLFGDALDGLAELVAKTGIKRSGWESMRMYALITILGRGSAKAGSEFVQNGAHWSDILPALADGFDATKWTASDWANLLLITAAGPFIATSPVAEAVAGLTLPAPLAAAVGLPAGVVAGPTLGAAADGAFWNGAMTAVGAIGVNGEPADSADVWSSTATSTALGGAAGMAARTYTNWRGATSETAGMDATTFWRTLIAFPADVGIAAGTATPPPGNPTPVPEPVEPSAPPRFQPKVVGGKKVTVQPGESLSEIAERDLGDANRWPALQKANPDPVDGHPDLIHPGDEIVEPLLPDRERPAH
jgi:nucleoid-associated protein YgaU